MSGLPKRCHRVAGNGYLTGIWGENIHWGLLWSIKELIPSRPSYESAPSWSWASTDGTIYHPFYVDELVAVVELIKVERFSDGRFEPADWLVGPGRLTILASLKQINNIGNYDSIKTEQVGGDRRALGRAILETSDQGKTEKIGWLALDKEDKTKGYKQGLWCIQIARYPNEPDDYVLFLVESCEEPKTYQRVGMGSIYGKHKWYADAISVEISIT